MSKFFDMAEIRGKSSDGDSWTYREIAWQKTEKTAKRTAPPDMGRPAGGAVFRPAVAQWNRAAEAVHGKRYAVITVPALPLTASFALPREVISTFPVRTFSR